MSGDAIFLLRGNDQLEKVSFGTYVSEEHLQDLLARFPELIPGEQISQDDPLRWLLVCREAGVPDAESAGGRWSLDHLLLDHRAVPTFVEVKRSSDTRIRREVVGQMLDYAANATRYWPADRIRALAAAQAGSAEALDERIRNLLQLSPDEGGEAVEAYWTRVEENLRNGAVRLLFVADELPRELRRLIEFLNEQMPRIEVLGVELRQYAGSEVRALVPRVVGQTQRALDTKPVASPPRRLTTEAEFLSSMPDWAKSFFGSIFAAARERGLVLSWGTKGFGVRASDAAGQLTSVLYGYPKGAMGFDSPSLEVYLKNLNGDAASALRSELLRHGAFAEAGQQTLRMVLSAERLTDAQAALPIVWKAYESIRGPERRHPAPA